MKTRFAVILLFGCFITYSSCRSRAQNTSERSYCITRVWYQIAKAPNPDVIYCTIDIPDSSLFFNLIANVDKFRLKYYGSIFSIDTFHILSPTAGAYLKDSSLIIGQLCSDLTIYSKDVLDSLLLRTNLDISIEVQDTSTNQKWVFKGCPKNLPIQKE